MTMALYQGLLENLPVTASPYTGKDPPSSGRYAAAPRETLVKPYEGRCAGVLREGRVLQVEYSFLRMKKGKIRASSG
jgi:hypothetical protein